MNDQCRRWWGVVLHHLILRTTNMLHGKHSQNINMDPGCSVTRFPDGFGIDKKPRPPGEFGSRASSKKEQREQSEFHGRKWSGKGNRPSPVRLAVPNKPKNCWLFEVVCCHWESAFVGIWQRKKQRDEDGASRWSTLAVMNLPWN